ncbi:3-carboxyethylcatechol 2,3-dioxygenase [Pseudomonas sp. TTU2014-080ASC]|uniref:3-carboxyethylcatechol 2,3-dioxygenase n=1 Tax=Pseudomonas sp. TTU2014-080ASC TaxID=1729724 RepID=UPI00071883F4|nr:3-carboxyethylcatechol 2,3-dioxygenase [Pseudomonas sp. TTU2014-080ASC]KRW61058.1 3-(2,3-dihydroxyphenyl)propionate dioxygenase [Pseudomonas sp. TTU2014-080ASC]
MSVYLHCLSHTPLMGHVDPAQEVLDEVDGVISAARQRIAEFGPELVILFSPDHYNGFFYDVMPSFCIGMAAHAIGDFGTLAGPLLVPQALAESCAEAVLAAGVDSAVSYRMQLDHGSAQPLEMLVGGLREVPVIPVFINSVATPLPGFQRARLLGEAIGRWASSLDKRVLLIGSGGLSHQPPVPELANVEGLMADRLKGSGRHLPADEREARTQRVILAAQRFVKEPESLYPLNPEWDQRFLSLLEQGQISELDSMSNAELSVLAGKSSHEIKTWVAAFAALSSYGTYQAHDRYYRPVPEWIAGFGSLSARLV